MDAEARRALPREEEKAETRAVPVRDVRGAGGGGGPPPRGGGPARERRGAGAGRARRRRAEAAAGRVGIAREWAGARVVRERGAM